MEIHPQNVVDLDTLHAQTGNTWTSHHWLEITQPMIDRFAEATFDHQFIHVDPVAASQTPFGSTIAHGFLTLSLIPHLLSPLQLIPRGATTCINYGLNKVRFPSAVKVNSRIRAAVTLKAIEVSAPEQVRMIWGIEVQIEGENKPALVAESLLLWLLQEETPATGARS